MKPVAVRQIQRCSPDTISRLAELGVATVHEAVGRTGLLDTSIRPVLPGVRLAGSAITVLTQPGDNWMVHVAIELCQPGDVLVVACTTDNTDGMFGDLLATSAQAFGVAGIVTETGIRDVKEIRKMGFPAWSRAFSAKGTVKNTLGCVNVPIICAGQLVHPGDVVVADDDGVVIVPGKQAEKVRKAGELREADEAEIREQLSRGVSSLDIFRLRSRLESAGLTYVDSLNDLGPDE